MYQTYWQLNEKPFESTADARFFYPGEAHQGAMLKLRYAVENRRAGALLVGAAGLGKTLSADRVLAQMPEQFAPRRYVVFPSMTSEQLLAYLAEELAGHASAGPPEPVASNVRRIERMLAENAKAGRHAVIVVDEAHLLEQAGSLDTIRLLLNFQTAGRPNLTLVLVAQPSILPALERMPDLEQRLGVKCLLKPLTAEETIGYVNFRMTAAGATRDVFEPEALEAVHYLSRGVPRRIDRLCDLSLLVGFAEEQATISAVQIEAVSEELITVTAD